MLMCVGLLLLYLRRLQQINKEVAQDYAPGRQNMTHSSTNDATPPASQAESIAATEVVGSSLSHQSPPAQMSFWVRVREEIRHPVNTIRQFFHPKEPFPVLVLGVALYGLWDRMPPPLEDPPQLPRGVWVRQRRIGLWHATHLVWQPASAGNNEPWITATQASDTVTILVNFLDKIAASVSGGPQGREPARLVYRILHVEELKAQKPRLYRFRSRRKEDLIKQSEIDVQEAFVEELQRQFGLAEEDPQSGQIPSRLTHYDRRTLRRGWLVISPRQALVAGVGAEETRTLANLIQPSDIDTSGKIKRILPEHYGDVLERVALWNGMQEIIAETANRFSVLVESGKKSTDGQVLLNFALAFISALLAIITLPHLNPWQIYSLGLIVGASILFWLYARSGYIRWLTLGLLVIAAAILLAIASFWYGSIIHFLSGLHL